MTKFCLKIERVNLTSRLNSIKAFQKHVKIILLRAKSYEKTAGERPIEKDNCYLGFKP